MSFTRKVAYNTFVQILGKGFGTILGLITVGLMTRYLHTEGFGYYSTVITYLSFFGIIIEFGLHITTLQLVSEGKYNKDILVSNIFTLRIISALIAFSIAPVLIWFFPYPDTVKWGVLVATGSFLFITLNQILIGILQINLRMDRGSFAEVVGRLVLLCGVGIGIYRGWGFLFIMLAIVLGSFSNFLMNFFSTRKYIKLSFKFDFVLWRIVLIRSWPIGLSIFFNLLYLKADMLILSLVRTQSEVGIYGATYRFLDVLTTIPAMFMGLILPTLRASWVSQDYEKFKRVFQKAFDFLVILSVPIIFGTIAVADKIILLIAGDQFTDAIPVLQLIIISLAAIFIGGGLYGYTIIALNKQRSMMWGYGITALFSLTLYFIFIPKYSYFGAASVTVFSEYLISALIIFVVYKTSRYIPRLGSLVKSLCASVIMFYALRFFHDFNLFVLVVIGAMIYTTVLLLMKGVSKEMIYEVLALKQSGK